VTDVLAEGRRAKLERQRALGEALCGPSEPEPEAHDVVLDELADAVTNRILHRLAPHAEPERPPGGSFDGGARRSVPPRPESHERWLMRVIRSRAANVGARF
jgi:hypothetical protein